MHFSQAEIGYKVIQKGKGVRMICLLKCKKRHISAEFSDSALCHVGVLSTISFVEKEGSWK